MEINLLRLMNEGACYDLLRELRWADGVSCTFCGVPIGIRINIVKNGHHNTNSLQET